MLDEGNSWCTIKDQKLHHIDYHEFTRPKDVIRKQLKCE